MNEKIKAIFMYTGIAVVLFLFSAVFIFGVFGMIDYFTPSKTIVSYPVRVIEVENIVERNVTQPVEIHIDNNVLKDCVRINGDIVGECDVDGLK